MNPTKAPSPWKRRRERSLRRQALALVLALLGHVAFVALLVLYGALAPATPRPPPPRAVSMRTLSPEEFARNRQATRSSPSAPTARGPRRDPQQPPVPPAPEKPKPAPEDNEDLSSARTAPGNGQKPTEKARNAETDNTVERETVAREQDRVYRNIASKRTAEQGAASQGRGTGQQEASGNGGTGSDQGAAAEQQARAALELKRTTRRDEVALKTDSQTPGPGVAAANRRESEALDGNSQKTDIRQGSGDADTQGSRGHVGQSGLAALMPSEAAMGRIIGSAPNDYYEEVDEGEETLLNTRSWKYASFFNRLYQRVGEEWHVEREVRRRDSTFEIYGGRKYITIVGVTLDANGTVANLELLQSSGVAFLDQEALGAFRRNGAFPNLPKGLVKENGQLRLRYGFIVDMTGASRRDSLRFGR